MHAELRQADQSFSRAFYLRRRLHGGVWGLYRRTLDSRRGRVVTRPQISTRDLDFERDERKCPQQCWRQRLGSWVESNYLGPGVLLARCGGRNRIWGVITIYPHGEDRACGAKLLCNSLVR